MHRKHASLGNGIAAEGTGSRASSVATDLELEASGSEGDGCNGQPVRDDNEAPLMRGLAALQLLHGTEGVETASGSELSVVSAFLLNKPADVLPNYPALAGKRAQRDMQHGFR